MSSIKLKVALAQPNLGSLEGSVISGDMFGVNFLSGYEAGDTKVGGATYDDVIHALGGTSQVGSFGDHSGIVTPVSNLRFPGGSLTEDFYMRNPLSITMPVGVKHGHDTPTALPNFLLMCQGLGTNMTFVMPTRRYLDTNGLTVGDKAEMTTFIKELLLDASDKGVDLQAIELGNEYWGFDGIMTTEQYGQIAAAEALTIQQAITEFSAEQTAEGVDMALWHEPKILLQMGSQYGDSKQAQKEMKAIISQFSTVKERAAIDGFIHHFYLPGEPETADGLWVDERHLYVNDMDILLTAPGWKSCSQMEFRISEWNAKLNNTASGLQSYTQMVAIFSALARNGINAADFWSVEDRSKFSLTRHAHGGGGESEIFEGLSFTGEAFRMLSESTRGKQVLATTVASSGSSEALVQAFSGGSEFVLFVSSRSDATDNVWLDLSKLIGPNISHIWGSRVATAGSSPLDQSAPPVVTNMNLALKSGILSGIELAPWETLRITITLGQNGAHILGYTGMDSLTGGRFADALDGKAGDDRLMGLDGNDTIWGGEGHDKIYGGADDRDLLFGGDGNDIIEGGRNGDSKIFGDAGNDVLEGGNASNDSLYGGSGDDSMSGGTGNDIISGGGGIDTAYFWGARKITVDLALTASQATGYGKDQLQSIEVLKTGPNNDILMGGSANEAFYSYDGNDVLGGRNGSDRLYGGSGQDTLYGGNGKDYVDGGKGNDLLLGDAGNDALHGSEGNDWLKAGSGTDSLYGGAGNDTLTGGAGADQFVFFLGSGTDKVTDFVDNLDLIHIAAPGLDFDDLTIRYSSGNTSVCHGSDFAFVLEGVTGGLTITDFLFR
ncbi:MAG: Alkaline phosphatase [Cypionkella sp.]|uniref:calcium-binding protein n=1 Tax=Cypionkella sp. TaxID=2811411 RepID=UPI0026194FEE|nr:calcium-binding protein [Cypionkella sp.]MDB5660829.1 Alkaline phosphatase [Cypionkella sp.]